MITRDNYDRFIAIRNSAMLHTNLQFAADLRKAGLTVDDLGASDAPSVGTYRWKTPYGTLVEHHGHMEWAGEMAHG